MPSNQIQYYSHFDPEFEKMGKSFIAIDDKAFPLGPEINKGNYGRLLACSEHIVVKKINYACRNLGGVHNTEIEMFELAQIQIEEQVFRARYQFCALFVLPKSYTAVLVMLKIPGTQLYNSKKNTVNKAIFSKKGFLNTYIKLLIEADLLHKQGIVHGDLGLTNCLLDELGYVYLTDFGFSRFLDGDIDTCGKRGDCLYLAPELKDPIPPKTDQDVYSLGKMFEYYDTFIDPEFKPFEKDDFCCNLAKRMCASEPDARITLDIAIAECSKYYAETYPEDKDFLTEIARRSPQPPLPTELIDGGEETDDIYATLDRVFNKLSVLRNNKKHYTLILSRIKDTTDFLSFIKLFPDMDRMKVVDELFSRSDFFDKILNGKQENLIAILIHFLPEHRIRLITLLDNPLLRTLIKYKTSIFANILELISPKAQMTFIKKMGKEFLLQITGKSEEECKERTLDLILPKIESFHYEIFFELCGTSHLTSQIKHGDDLLKIANTLPEEQVNRFIYFFIKQLIGNDSIKTTLPIIDPYLEIKAEHSYFFKKKILLTLLQIYRESLETREATKPQQYFWAKENTSIGGFLFRQPTLSEKRKDANILQDSIETNKIPSCEGAMNDGTLKKIWERANVIISAYAKLQELNIDDLRCE